MREAQAVVPPRTAGHAHEGQGPLAARQKGKDGGPAEGDYENRAAANSRGSKGWRSSGDSPTPT
jgi:hypothetical protein